MNVRKLVRLIRLMESSYLQALAHMDYSEEEITNVHETHTAEILDALSGTDTLDIPTALIAEVGLLEAAIIVSISMGYPLDDLSKISRTPHSVLASIIARMMDGDYLRNGSNGGVVENPKKVLSARALIKEWD